MTEMNSYSEFHTNEKKAIIKCVNDINSIIITIIRTQSYLIDEESKALVGLLNQSGKQAEMVRH